MLNPTDHSDHRKFYSLVFSEQNYVSCEEKIDRLGVGVLHQTLKGSTTNAPMSIANWRVVDNDRSGSDHLYIEFDLQSNVPDSGPRRPLFSRLDRETLVKSIDEQCKTLVDQKLTIDHTTISNILRKACTEASPPRPRSTNRKPAFWWNAEVASLRKECIRARRSYVRARRASSTGNTNDIQNYLKHYSDTKKKFHKAIVTAKRDSWKELITKLQEDIWGLPYKIIREKIGQKRLRLSEETVDKAIGALFP